MPDDFERHTYRSESQIVEWMYVLLTSKITVVMLKSSEKKINLLEKYLLIITFSSVGENWGTDSS